MDLRALVPAHTAVVMRTVASAGLPTLTAAAQRCVRNHRPLFADEMAVAPISDDRGRPILSAAQIAWLFREVVAACVSGWLAYHATLFVEQQ